MFWRAGGLSSTSNREPNKNHEDHKLFNVFRGAAAGVVLAGASGIGFAGNQWNCRRTHHVESRFVNMRLHQPRFRDL